MKRNESLLKGAFKDFRPLKEYFLKNRWPVAAGLISLLLVDLLQVLIPQVIKKAIDSLTFKTATSGILFKYGMMIMSIALAIALFRYMWRYLLFGHSRKVEEGLRNRLYDHLQTLSPSFFQRIKTGDLMARATNDVNAVRMATGFGIFAVTDSVVLGVATIVCMLYISPVLTLVSLIPAPILIYLTRMLSRRMSTGYERVQKTFADLTEEVREAFAGVRIVKAYSRESWECKKIEEGGGKYISENMQLAKTIAFFFPLMAVFANLGLAIMIWVGGRLTILGHLTTGDFVAFISYLYLLAWPLTAIGWVINLIQRGAASMRRINHILDEVPDILDPPYPRHVTKIAGSIKFKGLRYKYPGQTGFALNDINLSIERGQTVAFVGQVGSAKTTLLNTLPRLFDMPRGTVFIDGTDVHDIPLKTLRQNIGFVTQETLLFSDTIRNNILFGRRGISENALQAALRAAQISDEIQTFEKGLDTWLGEKGVTLSGGQRQRLTIARALISDAPIMILDDALSMVDTRTEARILNRIFEFRKHKTNLIVSHRVPTISRADLIVVLKGGELVEAGKHSTLMAMGNEYARLYQRQFLAQELEVGIT
jgi:ATP-binding cassette subfamily B protein